MQWSSYMWYFSTSNSLQIKKKIIIPTTPHTPPSHHSSWSKHGLPQFSEMLNRHYFVFCLFVFHVICCSWYLRLQGWTKRVPLDIYRMHTERCWCNFWEQQMLAVLWKCFSAKSWASSVVFHVAIWMDGIAKQLVWKLADSRGQSGYLRIWLGGLHALCCMQRY